MRCKSCQEDVPPKFTHALAVNICPLCGQEIMDVKLKNILGELKIALGDAKDYMEEVEDWLFSNFSLKKIKANETVIDKTQVKEKAPAAVIQHSGNPGAVVHRNEDSDEVIVEETPSKSTSMSVFAKRAGVSSHKKTIDFIKGKTSFGAADPSEFHGVDEEYGDVDFVSDEKDKNPLNVSERHQMENIFKGEDLGKTSHELELQKLKRLQAQNAVSGGGGGFFRRT